MLEDDGQFAYAMLKNLDHPTARYNPYDLVCVGSAQARNLKQMFTVTASAVTQVSDFVLLPGSPNTFLVSKSLNFHFERSVYINVEKVYR